MLRWIRYSVTSTSGTLIAKITRQENKSISAPPIGGPMRIEIPVQAVHEPIAAPRSSSPKVAVMIARVLGTSSAPAMPWSPRAKISALPLGATAHNSEQTPKAAIPIVKIRLRPKRSPSDPPTRMNALRVSR